MEAREVVEIEEDPILEEVAIFEAEMGVLGEDVILLHIEEAREEVMGVVEADMEVVVIEEVLMIDAEDNLWEVMMTEEAVADMTEVASKIDKADTIGGKVMVVMETVVVVADTTGKVGMTIGVVMRIEDLQWGDMRTEDQRQI